MPSVIAKTKLHRVNDKAIQARIDAYNKKKAEKFVSTKREVKLTLKCIFRKKHAAVRTPFYTYVNHGKLDFHSFSFLFVVVGTLAIISGVSYTWYDGISNAPFSNRVGPMIMGIGIFVVLCGLTYMLEVKDSKNRHFIVGDCFNNFIYNADPARSNQPLKKLTCLPTIVSTMQAQLTQRDHDGLLAQKVETESIRNFTRQNTRRCEC